MERFNPEMHLISRWYLIRVAFNIRSERYILNLSSILTGKPNWNNPEVNKMKKMKLKLSLSFLAILSIISITACTSPAPVATNQTAAVSGTQSPSLSSSAIPTTTEFDQMLGLVPYSFLKEHDVWFGDPGKAKQIFGIQDANSLESASNLSADEIKQLTTALSGVFLPGWRYSPLEPLTGFDGFMINRSAFTDTPSPWAFSISEGNFDQALIVAKLTEQGYQKISYGSSSYFSIYGDFSPGSLTQGQGLSPIVSQVMAAMNRVAVLDNTVITAPSTDIMTAILDTRDGKAASVAAEPAGKNLAASLGDVLSGVIMNPERALNMNPPQQMLPFHFTVPSDWGLLHQYDMVGMGYRNEGNNPEWIISLYYQDAQAASADAGTLVTRMKSYVFGTQQTGLMATPTPLTSLYTVGEPKVQQYQNGATLTVECTGRAWRYDLLTIRDLLFLAPDPSLYIAPASSEPTGAI